MSFAGIEHFPRLERLYAESNDATSIELSQNERLIELSLAGNYLTAIDVTHNPALEMLNVGDAWMEQDGEWVQRKNRITSLNLSQNPDLRDLNVSWNALEGLDLSRNTALAILRCPMCGLTEIDVSMLPNLRELHIDGNSLSEIDVSGNPALATLNVSNNSIQSLSVSGNTHLERLSFSGTEIEEIDLSQNSNLVYLDTPDLVSLTLADGTGSFGGWLRLKEQQPALDGETLCFDLTWLQSLERLAQAQEQNGFDENVTLDKENGRIVFANEEAAQDREIQFEIPQEGDDWETYLNVQITVYGERQEPDNPDEPDDPETRVYLNAENFPDENFLNWLLNGDGHPDYTIAEENDETVYYYTARQANSIDYLDVSGREIESLAGIGFFTELKHLYCGEGWNDYGTVNNHIGALDLSANTKLESLYCSYNPLETLDLSQNEALVSIDCDDGVTTAYADNVQMRYTLKTTVTDYNDNGEEILASKSYRFANKDAAIKRMKQLDTAVLFDADDHGGSDVIVFCKDANDIPQSPLADRNKTLFAGWFADAAYTEPGRNDDGTFAKFVDPNVLRVGVQFRHPSGSGEPDTSDMRLITSLPGKEGEMYGTVAAVGFRVERLYADGSVMLTVADVSFSKEIYSYVTGNAEDGTMKVTTNAFSADSAKVAALSVRKMPNSFFNREIPFRVTPYMVLNDHTIVEGNAIQFITCYDENGVRTARTFVPANNGD